MLGRNQLKSVLRTVDLVGRISVPLKWTKRPRSMPELIRSLNGFVENEDDMIDDILYNNQHVNPNLAIIQGHRMANHDASQTLFPLRDCGIIMQLVCAAPL